LRHRHGSVSGGAPTPYRSPCVSVTIIVAHLLRMPPVLPGRQRQGRDQRRDLSMTNVLDSTIMQISRICVVIGLSQASYSAAQIGGYLKSIWDKPWWSEGFASETCR
jgi:hypothetical protein